MTKTKTLMSDCLGFVLYSALCSSNMTLRKLLNFRPIVSSSKNRAKNILTSESFWEDWNELLYEFWNISTPMRSFVQLFACCYGKLKEREAMCANTQGTVATIMLINELIFLKFLSLLQTSHLATNVSVQFSRSVVSNCLWPHESQHARPLCPSPTTGVHSDSPPWSQWCHPAISSSVGPFFSLPPIPPSIRVFSNESTLRIRWPKYWSFSFSIIPSEEIPRLISFRMDWLDLQNLQTKSKT